MLVTQGLISKGKDKKIHQWSAVLQDQYSSRSLPSLPWWFDYYVCIATVNLLQEHELKREFSNLKTGLSGWILSPQSHVFEQSLHLGHLYNLSRGIRIGYCSSNCWFIWKCWQCFTVTMYQYDYSFGAKGQGVLPKWGDRQLSVEIAHNLQANTKENCILFMWWMSLVLHTAPSVSLLGVLIIYKVEFGVLGKEWEASTLKSAKLYHKRLMWVLYSILDLGACRETGREGVRVCQRRITHSKKGEQW